MAELDILTVGLACPLGLRALDAVASLRTNLRSVYRLDGADELEARFGAAIRASRSLELGSSLLRSQRAGHYAALALREAASPFGAHLRGSPLYLATPEAGAEADFDLREVLGDEPGGEPNANLGAMFSAIHRFPSGRAGVFAALERAREDIERGGYSMAVVGGVDSMADHASLQRLAEANALLGDANADGLIPGEGAAFLVLARSTMGLPGRPPLARLGAVARGQEQLPPARASADRPPSEAAGLTAVLASVRARDDRRYDALHSAQPPQRHWVRELAFATARHRAGFAEPLVVHACAEALGDLGAAAGAVALVRAILELHPLIPGRPQPTPPPDHVLVYACSDAGEVGAASVSALRLRPGWT